MLDFTQYLSVLAATVVANFLDAPLLNGGRRLFLHPRLE
jgi:hypothetical protein